MATDEPKTTKKKRAPAPTTPHKAGRLALVGRPNVGKSTLLNALLGERIAIVSKHPQTTRDRIAGVISTDHAQLVFLDTPGIHPPRSKLGQRMNDLAWQTANDADVIVFLAEAFVDSKDPIHNVDRTLIPKLPKKPTILALTKVDLIKKKERLFPILEAWSALRAQDGGWAAIVPLSALKSSGTQRLIQVATELMPEGESLFPDDEISDKPSRFFVAEFVREQILKKTFEEVPHGVAVTVERYDEGGKIPVIDVAIHVTKEAHKRIVIGAKGELLKNVGIEARARAEALLGTQVHLKLWVRVTPDWQENDANLRDFGYDAANNK